MPFLGEKRIEAPKGPAACGLCTGELAFPSARSAGGDGKDVREAPEGHSHRPVPKHGGIAAESAGEDAHSAGAVGFAQFCSHLGLFPALGVGFPRDISHARSSHRFFPARAFWGIQIARKEGFFQARGGIISEGR